MLKVSTLTGAALASLFAAPIASAQEYTVVAQRIDDWQPHSTVVMVPAGDLDLNSKAGEDALEARVRDAVVLACDDALGKAAHPRNEFDCRLAAIRSAHRQMDVLVDRARARETAGYPIVASAITLRIAQ